jgi:hypothetical protein
MQEIKTWFNPLCYNLCMGKDKQVEGEWPLYPEGAHPDVGIPGRDQGVKRRRKLAITEDSSRALPYRRELKKFRVRLERGIVINDSGFDYTIGHRTVDVWTAKMDPEPHRITSIRDITVIALEQEPRSKKASGARTDAYITDTPPAKGQLVRPRLFSNGLSDVARVSVFWSDIKAPRPTS